MNIAIWGNELNAWAMAAMLAECGNQVAMPQQSSPPTSEPNLDKLLQKHTALHNIRFCDIADTLTADIHFFSFGADQKNQALDLAKDLGGQCPQNMILINQSNFGIGATEQLRAHLAPAHQVAYIPDNVPEGRALNYLRNLPSLSLGCDHPESADKIRALMRPFLLDPQKVLIMSPQEAEFAKFAVTGMLALRIGYINELANLADKLAVDIEPIRHAMTLDSRISPEYLKPGCGFGGLNFPQYITGLAEILQEERRSTLLDSVLKQNDRQKETPFRKLWRHYKGRLEGKIISIWGLSFKPNTSSINNAPSLKVIDALLSQGVTIKAHDPEAMEHIASRYAGNKRIVLCDTNYEALDHSDGLIILTEWREYSTPDFTNMAERMNTAIIIDGRNLLDKCQAQNAGFYYEGIGR